MSLSGLGGAGGCSVVQDERTRMSETVHDSFQLSSHPLLSCCLPTVQFHHYHRAAGLPDQLMQFVCAIRPQRNTAKKVTKAITDW